MARTTQQQRRAPQKHPKDGGTPAGNPGEITDVPESRPPRVSIEGECLEAEDRSKYTLISQTNGEIETIMYLKNTGDCGPLTIMCLEGGGREVPNTRVTLQKGDSIRRYSSTSRTFSIVFFCKREGNGGPCKLEFDR